MATTLSGQAPAKVITATKPELPYHAPADMKWMLGSVSRS